MVVRNRINVTDTDGNDVHINSDHITMVFRSNTKPDETFIWLVSGEKRNLRIGADELLKLIDNQMKS
jgi:uncharacterized protein YlzI (FlbEa/FlbD family)